jgi:ATP-dependent DNA ligase
MHRANLIFNQKSNQAMRAFMCGQDGVSEFDRLRSAVGRMGSRDAFLYAFDLLEIDGEDLRPYEWHVRRAALRSLLRKVRAFMRLT